MAKRIGAKEAAMRQHREQSAGSIMQLDRTAIARARGEARQLADQLFQKEMAKHLKPIDDRLAEITERLAAIDEETAVLTKEQNGLAKTRADLLGEAAPAGNGTAGRGAGSRFPSDQMPAVAASIGEFIVKSKADGVSGNDIREHVSANFKKPNGEPYKLLPTINILEFVKEHKAPFNVAKTGVAASTRYYHRDHVPA